MREYTPHCWKVIEIKYDADAATHYRVAAGWRGGYLDGDSWKINSGIAAFDYDGDYILFIGDTGSVYRCHRNAEGLNGYTSSVVESYNTDHEKLGGYVKQISFEEFLRA